MSFRNITAIKSLVEPWATSWDAKPTADDSWHFTFTDTAGTYHEFSTIQQAMDYANRQRLGIAS